MGKGPGNLGVHLCSALYISVYSTAYIPVDMVCALVLLSAWLCDLRQWYDMAPLLCHQLFLVQLLFSPLGEQ